MGNKIFRQVLCSERLPIKKGYYIVNSKCNSTTATESADSILFNEGEFSNIPNWVHLWWLEEVELPSEKEINLIIDNLLIERGEHFSRVRNPIYGEERTLAQNTFNKAIELIKGGNNGNN